MLSVISYQLSVISYQSHAKVRAKTLAWKSILSMFTYFLTFDVQVFVKKLKSQIEIERNTE
ncbi:MAG TPA: hypothetical protein DCM38_11450 [Gammaproteobacteria bacterium]|nr:hypothetical protein [Gammaproteobacteria bacterium]